MARVANLGGADVLVDIATTVNGVRHDLTVPTNETLATCLRERLDLRGVKVSCGVQICGACTVLLDGRAVSACTVLAAEADGRELRTVEGLARDGELSAPQRAFVEHGALQCGFCTPGFLMAGTELLEQVADPDEETIRTWLAGNICRCTGYRPILEAVRDVAAARNDAARGEAGEAHGD
jgi:carbon-monoxide dehydrogenase small subunit